MLNYKPIPDVFDEVFINDGKIRSHYEQLFTYLKSLTTNHLQHKERICKHMFINNGITFTVYSDDAGIEKIFPFDIIPRIIPIIEWQKIERGIKQRLKALNLFLDDIYNNQAIIKDKIIPSQLVYSCPFYIREMIGVKLTKQNYITISGVDLIRNNDGEYYVLEDNLRTPSGVSYMIENREVSKRIFGDVLSQISIKSVDNYTYYLYNHLASYSPKPKSKPTIVLLTPGIYNSAYYEHSFLARYLGIDLVEGRDLIVENNMVFMKTTKGMTEVDVIYKRVDDEYLDPLVFNKNSLLGVPGLFSAFIKGNVAIVNSIGNGVADDKAIYLYVPEMIKYYLNEQPILKNITTYFLDKVEQREFVFNNINKMVIKKTNGSGGYGMLMGSTSSEAEIEEYKKIVLNTPREYIAQPIINFSTAPCYINNILTPRRIDLRPFALQGLTETNIVPGGLTRVALNKNSLIVNSSQGGGSKDTWVFENI